MAILDTGPVGVRNYLVEGVSCAGKTTVATELERRGHHVVHGDRVLAYQGDPLTEEPLPGHVHEHHVWDVAEVLWLHASREDIPASGIPIDSTRPLAEVVDEIE